MTALPTPETLRERAAAALARADRDATHTPADLYPVATDAECARRAVALAAYARECLTIAAELEPAPSTAAPAETSPPDAHEPARGDVYEYAGVHHSVFGANATVAILRPANGAPEWHATNDFVRRFCRRVSPPREAT